MVLFHILIAHIKHVHSGRATVFNPWQECAGVGDGTRPALCELQLPGREVKE